MINIFTKGTRGIKVLGDPNRSLGYVPSNEDWSFVVDIVSISLLSESVVIEGTKVWDEATIKTSFFAMATNNYKFQEGGQAIFYRVGDGDNSPTLTDFQLHDLANTDKSSFFAVPYAQMVFVEDIGSGQGRVVDFDAAGTKFIPTNSVTGNLATVEPLANFHNGNPPYRMNRIYPAQMIGNIFLVYLPGFGDTDNEQQVVIDGVTTTWSYDNSGKLINLVADGAPPCPDVDPTYLFRGYWSNVGNTTGFPFLSTSPTIYNDGGRLVAGLLANLANGHDLTSTNWTVMAWQNWDGTAYSNMLFSSAPGQAYMNPAVQPPFNFNSLFIEQVREFTPNKSTFFNGDVDWYVDPPSVYLQICDADQDRSTDHSLTGQVLGYSKWILSPIEILPIYDPVNDQSFNGATPMPSIPFAAVRSAVGSGWNEIASDYILFLPGTFGPDNGNLIPGWGDLLVPPNFNHIGGYMAASGIVNVVNSPNFGPLLVFRREREHHFFWNGTQFLDQTNSANSGAGYTKGADRWITPRFNTNLISSSFPFSN